MYRTANDYGFLYGLFAVALAMVTGWLGRIIFKKD
ncbi:TIGR02186 family protein [Rhizobiaceae sp. 2RAB30]